MKLHCPLCKVYVEPKVTTWKFTLPKPGEQTAYSCPQCTCFLKPITDGEAKDGNNG